MARRSRAGARSFAGLLVRWRVQAHMHAHTYTTRSFRSHHTFVPRFVGARTAVPFRPTLPSPPFGRVPPVGPSRSYPSGRIRVHKRSRVPPPDRALQERQCSCATSHPAYSRLFCREWARLAQRAQAARTPTLSRGTRCLAPLCGWVCLGSLAPPTKGREGYESRLSLAAHPLPLPRFSGIFFGKQTPRGVSGCWQFPWKTDHPERNLTGNLNVGGPGKGSITTRTLGTFPTNPKRSVAYGCLVCLSRDSTGTRPVLDQHLNVTILQWLSPTQALGILSFGARNLRFFREISLENRPCFTRNVFRKTEGVAEEKRGKGKWWSVPTKNPTYHTAH